MLSFFTLHYIEWGFKKLDGLIKGFNKSETFTNILSLQEYKNPGIKDIVLAAPSMAGKTQIAFSGRSKRPLYFTLQIAQPISKNFKKLSIELVDAVMDDQDRILFEKGSSFKLGERKIINMDLISTWL